MSDLVVVLDAIYCLSQEIGYTIKNLISYPEIVKNANGRKLFTLFEELHGNSLEAFKDINLEMFQNDLVFYLDDILSLKPAIEETYKAFVNTISLSPDHILMRKLRLQVNRILCLLTKLARLSSGKKTFYNMDFIE